MTEPFFEFQWPVAPDYRWVEWLAPDGSPIRPSRSQLHADTSKITTVEKGKETGPVLMPTEGPHRFFRPMERENATLFQEFANLDASDLDTILGFVRKYGWLGVNPRASQNFRLPDGSMHFAVGEPYVIWVQEIALMRRAIWLWENPDYAEGDEEYLAWLYNVHLQEVQGRMTFAEATDPRLRVAPMTLLAAMWLQLALAVTGNKTFVKCKFCGQKIEISTAQSGFRTNREFCSASCKTLDYRKRKSETARLARQGATVIAIAKKVKTDLSTVRRWIKSSGRKVGKRKR